MTQRPTLFLCATLLACALLMGSAIHAGGYKNPEAISKAVKNIASSNGTVAKLHDLGKTAGGRDLLMLELGAKNNSGPAILLVANMEGNSPTGSEAALKLAELLTSEWKDDLSSNRWYIMPLGNPDGYARFFDSPLYESFVNDRSVNADKDDAFDEDGPDDLNGDGYITMMRQLHPEGRWLKVEDNPVLMRRAKRDEGEKGEYRLMVEGLDNDGDGSFNEDGSGGVNPGWNFPHRFRHYRSTNGLWAASELESRAVLTFAYDHPEIAMFIGFGRQNTLAAVSTGSKRGAGKGSYKLPSWMAENTGANPDQMYPIGEIVQMARDAFGNPGLTEDRVLQWLGAGAKLSPDKIDVSYLKEITERYKTFIKDAGFDSERLDAPKFRGGSIDEWAYYQFGVPAFSVDFWTVPIIEKEEEETDSTEITPAKIEEMSNEDFIALGAEKIDSLLKEAGVEKFTAEKLVTLLNEEKMSTKRIAKMLKSKMKDDEDSGADEDEQTLYDYNEKAFVPWTEYDHPTYGKVEIGGQVPYSDLAPDYAIVDSLVSGQLPFLRDLVKLLPKVEIGEVKIEKKGKDIWKVECWITNVGFLPYPTYQGKRSRRPIPAVVELEHGSATILEGDKILSAGLLPGTGGNKKVTWLLQGKVGTSITIDLKGFSAGKDKRTISLKEGGA